VATGRDSDVVTKALGQTEDLLVVKLDITSPADAQAAVTAALDRFGRGDVLVNNAATFPAGLLRGDQPGTVPCADRDESVRPADRVLPVMRRQRSGHVGSITSIAGLVGQEFCAAYATSKFGPEGWMESLRFDVAPHAWASRRSSSPASSAQNCGGGLDDLAELSIDNYAERTAPTMAACQGMNGKQSGGPGQAGEGADHRHRPARAVDALDRRRRRARHRRTEGEAAADAGRRLPRGVQFPGDDATASA
jgi:hypothetical protein